VYFQRRERGKRRRRKKSNKNPVNVDGWIVTALLRFSRSPCCRRSTFRISPYFFPPVECIILSQSLFDGPEYIFVFFTAIECYKICGRYHQHPSGVPNNKTKSSYFYFDFQWVTTVIYGNESYPRITTSQTTDSAAIQTMRTLNFFYEQNWRRSESFTGSFSQKKKKKTNVTIT
jgi:hypothetical protein